MSRVWIQSPFLSFLSSRVLSRLRVLSFLFSLLFSLSACLTKGYDVLSYRSHRTYPFAVLTLTSPPSLGPFISVLPDSLARPHCATFGCPSEAELEIPLASRFAASVLWLSHATVLCLALATTFLQETH